MTISRFTAFFLMLALLFASACRSEFERLRVEGTLEERTEKGYAYYEAGEYYKAQVLFEGVIGTYRGRPEAEKIYFHYAYTHYHLGSYISAVYYFQTFANTFPRSEYREEALYMVAYSNYKLSPTFRLDQKYSREAIDAFQTFANTYPLSDRVQEANRFIDELRRKLERKAFEEGKLYFDLQEYLSATITLENLLKDYPETERAEEVRFLILKASYLLAENSVLAKQEERYEQTIKSYRTFANKYPSSDFGREAKSIFDDSTNKLADIKQ